MHEDLQSDRVSGAGAFADFAETGADMMASVARLGEIALDAGTVIGHRISLALSAIDDPAAIDHAEFTRMTTEKLDAAADVAAGAIGSALGFAQTLATLSLDQAQAFTAAAVALGAARTPAAAMAAQQLWATESLALAGAQALQLFGLVADAAAAAIAPVHSRAAANALRLTNAYRTRRG